MKKSLIGAVAALMACQTAYAADALQAEPPTFIDTPPEVQVQEASGWYLRGDVGYSFNKAKSFEFSRINAGGDYETVRSSSSSTKDSFLAGAGVGYQINNYLRTDLTFDYMAKSNFRGSAVAVGGGNDEFRSSLRAYSLMANAYVDLGTYGRITPYLGAGIGGAYVQWDKVKITDPCGDCEFEKKGDWRFAYALMAGASIDVTCNLKADVGYRFRQIGKGEMFGIGSGGNAGGGRDKGLTSHEVRVGGRYVFNGCDTAQYIPPADIPLQPAVYK